MVQWPDVSNNGGKEAADRKWWLLDELPFSQAEGSELPCIPTRLTVITQDMDEKLWQSYLTHN